MINLVLTADPIIKACDGVDTVIVDTETSSLYPWRDGKILAGIGIKPLDGECFYLPVRHKNGGRQAPLKELKRVCEALRGKTLIFHNPKFDLAVLWQDEVDLVDERCLDTVVIVRLVSEDEPSYELKRLAKKYIDATADEEQKKLKRLMKQMGWSTYDEVPAELICPYVEKDLLYTEGLYVRAMPFIEQRGLEELFELEVQLTRCLFHLERRGFLLDRKYVKQELHSVKKLINELEQQAYALVRKALNKRAKELEVAAVVRLWLKLTKREQAAELKLRRYNDETKQLFVGVACLKEERKVAKAKIIKTGEFDIRSPHDIKKVFEALGIESSSTTAKGAASWSKTALADIDHPLADLVVRVRAAYNISNYYISFIELMDENDVIHCSIHQAGTKTGRCSCREPNLQNIPRFEGFTGSVTGAVASMKKLKRQQAASERKKQRYKETGRTQITFDDEVAQEILNSFEGEMFGKVRGSFVPRPGNFLLFVDWSQIELRIFADYAKELELLHVFDLGLDVHRLTALAAFGSLPDPKKNKQMYDWVRNMGKQIAFGLLYGMGISLLAVEIGRSKDEAKEFMERYFARFKHAKKFIEQVQHECTKLGYGTDMWGRRRYLIEKLVYKIVNFMVQGTAADLMKDAMVRVCDVLMPFKTKLLLTVHDELIFEVPYEEVEQVVPLIVQEMNISDKVKAKLRCDVEWSPTSWGDKRSLKCGQCDGRGQLVSLPGVVAEQVQDVLLTGLYENDVKLLETAKISDCETCDSKGYSLDKIVKSKEQKAANA